MITIGLTGRSGCGKSTVAAQFVAKGVPCADADALSRALLQPGSPVLAQLAARFGADILDEAGALKRRLLADRALATPEGTAALNAITHPPIIRAIRQAKQAARAAGAPLFLIDGAVIVGTACEAECDKLVVVTAPLQASVARIMARDGISREMALRRLAAQMPEEQLCAKADYLLRNEGSLGALAAAAGALYGQLLAMADKTEQGGGGHCGGMA